jgi:hypothetical protein
MTADRILDVIDAGLQTPVPDPTFGEISPEDHGGCTRCDADVPESVDLCDGCRAFLLGDSEVDPVGYGIMSTEVALANLANHLPVLRQAVVRISEQFIEGINNFAAVMADLPDETKAALLGAVEDADNRHRPC